MLGGFAEEYGMSLEHAVRAACAFGGGVAELLGVDIGTGEGRERAMREGLFTTLCPVFVHDAATFAVELVRRA